MLVQLVLAAKCAEERKAEFIHSARAAKNRFAKE